MQKVGRFGLSVVCRFFFVKSCMQQPRCIIHANRLPIPPGAEDASKAMPVLLRLFAKAFFYAAP